MTVWRKILPVTAMALCLGAAPALAQLAPAPTAAPEDPTAARTLEQNRRVVIGPPAPSDEAGDRAGAAPTSGAGRVGLVAGEGQGRRTPLASDDAPSRRRLPRE